MKLTEIDFKLLSYLYHNYRESVSKIAKETKLTREQVEYRLKKHQKEGLIKQFIPIFNYPKMGYEVIATLFMKFDKNLSVGKKGKEFSEDKNIISWGKVYGRYDVYLVAVFKNEKELNDFISRLLEDTEDPVVDYNVIKPYFAELYPLKMFKHKVKDYTLVESDFKIVKLDEKDKEILKSFSADGRVRLIDIANKTKISSELALYKIRRLKYEGIIIGNRIQFDMGKLGYFFTLVLINVRHFSESNKKKLRDFANNYEHANSLIFSLQKPNCILQLFHKDEKELRLSIEKIKGLFKDEYIDIDILPIGEDEGKIRTLPFL